MIQGARAVRHSQMEEQRTARPLIPKLRQTDVDGSLSIVAVRALWPLPTLCRAIPGRGHLPSSDHAGVLPSLT
jgi:hypothetical protein